MRKALFSFPVLLATVPTTLQSRPTFRKKLFQAGNGLPNLATAMDISPDGERLALLTYSTAIELLFDVETALPILERLVEAETWQAIPTATLIQAESIAYGADGRSLTYTTESIRGSAAPLVRNVCQ